MFTIHGSESGSSNCRGLSRRSFLRAGSLGLGGFTFADLLRAEQSANTGSSNKAIIHIHLDGGPPQMDLIDPKPDAPTSYRSPFAPLPTNVPGLHLTELLPKVASAADRFVFLRSLVGAEGKHDAFQCQSGYSDKTLSSMGGRPAMGCVVGKLLGNPHDPAPAFVDLMQGRPLARNSARPGFLGPSHNPFRPDISHLFQRELEDGMKIELAKLGAAGHRPSLSISDGLTAGRIDSRLGLLRSLDATRRQIDATGSMHAMDQFTQQAYTILTSGKIAAALDIEKEHPRTIAHYTPPDASSGLATYTSESPKAALKLLIARRLVEAGVRVVSVSLSDFDTHQGNDKRMRTLGPIVDHALHALVTDLADRGMLNDVTVLAWGEFGRTPKPNKDGGRDHWPRVAMGIMAGGGMPSGFALGATDRYAGEATERPLHYQDVIATLYNNLGINPNTTTVTDPTGRPQYLTELGHPISELT